MEQQFLFVYGTLLSALRHPVFLQVAPFLSLVGKASVPGKLYDLGGYPGLKVGAGSQAKVHGELFEISSYERVFGRLDSYEGISRPPSPDDEYYRAKLRLDGRNGLMAWAYIYRRKVEESKIILPGDYLEYYRGRKG